MIRRLETKPTVDESDDIEYPESDGKPMAENTEQYEWIVTIKEGLEKLFRHDPMVFVAADLFWYPVRGKNAIRQAPDAMVAFGRPKGRRGSYKQWCEDDIAPQVVFEILSPGNRPSAMRSKLWFYEQYGVEEYYLYDPDRLTLAGFRREHDRLAPIAAMSGWVSPRLGIRFEMIDGQLVVFDPDGQPFKPVQAIHQELDQVTTERNELKATLSDVQGELVHTAEERDLIAAERDTIAEERDLIAAERDTIAGERDLIAGERNLIAEERDKLAEERDTAIQQAREKDEQVRARDEQLERLREKLKSLGIDPEA